ncbi:MAG: MBL fold metallo-hydrolase [Deltaproteobacteria bacterium]|nr:MBL fold metallo-hydrolase [Deltaproteobacteria bacterium]MBW2071306.1 MBL fold metallo-hydrolase [Deltaproteobacteria bacterium]
MRIIFLGTGAAWALPEIGCDCRICREMQRRGEARRRTAIYLEAQEKILIDCGPDIRQQWHDNGLEGVDAVLITHEHGDHYLGLDELVALRRSADPSNWQSIPVYATERTWQAIEQRFGYLLEKTLAKKMVTPGERVADLRTSIVPFKTYHGPVAAGSVGYMIEDNGKRIVYTSDLLNLDSEAEVLQRPDVLIIQSHWLNEPQKNRPSHLSLQRALPLIRKWQPREHVYLVHISDADQVPGDPANVYLKKVPPAQPLCPPGSNTPYPVPTCQQEWQQVVEQVFGDHGLQVAVTVAYDGLQVEV